MSSCYNVYTRDMAVTPLKQLARIKPRQIGLISLRWVQTESASTHQRTHIFQTHSEPACGHGSIAD